jgi:hypothetical protein
MEFFLIAIFSCRRDEFIIALAAALRSEKVIITAAQAVRIFATDCGPRMIDCAASLFGIQKLADPFEDVIFLMAKHAVAESNLGVTFFGILIGNAEMFGYTKQVCFRDLYSIIATAVCRALRTVE